MRSARGRGLGSARRLHPPPAIMDDVSMHAKSCKTAFPRCDFINLRSRQDRRQRVDAEMGKAGLQCGRVEAVNASEAGTAVDACRSSHVKALQAFKASGAPYGLILEDDVVWKKDVPLWMVEDRLCAAEKQIKDHPVLLLSCNPYGEIGKSPLGSLLPADGQPLLREVNGCQTASAYIVRQDYVDKLLAVWENVAPGAHTRACDQLWKPLQKRDGWAMTEPLLIEQGRSYSDIEAKVVDYGVF